VTPGGSVNGTLVDGRFRPCARHEGASSHVRSTKRHLSRVDRLGFEGCSGDFYVTLAHFEAWKWL
jgi:hypothetical protein